MFEEHSQADPQLARTAELMAEAGSLADVVSILTRTGRWIAGSDGIAVVLRENDVCAYVAEARRIEHEVTSALHEGAAPEATDPANLFTTVVPESA